MDSRIVGLLQGLRLNVDVINEEIRRLHRSELFTADAHCLQLIEQLRTSYLQGLEALRYMERGLRQ